MPQKNERFTEFYIVDAEGLTEKYPREIIFGETSELSIVVVNHEGIAINYKIEVSLNDRNVNEIDDLHLEDGEKMVETLEIKPEVKGESQKLSFFLYKDGNSEPLFEPLFLWINVKWRNAFCVEWFKQ